MKTFRFIGESTIYNLTNELFNSEIKLSFPSDYTLNDIINIGLKNNDGWLISEDAK